jgi:lipopolysaccharide biosynthesis protein
VSSSQIPVTTRYLLRVSRSGTCIDFPEAIRVQVHPIRIRDWLFVLRNARSRDQFWVPLQGGARLTPLLRWCGREGTTLLHTIRNLAGWGFSLPSSSLQLALTRHWRAADNGALPISVSDRRVAIVLHLHYHELWPEFEAALARVAEPFELIVTINARDPALECRIHSAFARSRIVVYPNKGRDVGPFIQLIRDGLLDGFSFVCKLHSKRSGELGPRAVLGAVWRWTLLRELVGSSAVVSQIIDRFAGDPTIGMIGSHRFRLPNQHKREVAAWGRNAEAVRRLAARLGLAPEAVKLDYFAGTMFWVRREVLMALKELNLSLDDFEEENGATDGALEHALERLFGIAVPAVGMRIVDVGDDDWE